MGFKQNNIIKREESQVITGSGNETSRLRAIGKVSDNSQEMLISKSTDF